jgi:hypothetical protein
LPNKEFYNGHTIIGVHNEENYANRYKRGVYFGDT